MIENREGAVTRAGSHELHQLGGLEAARTFGKGVALEDGMTAIVDAAVELTYAQQGALLLVKPSGALEVTVVRDAQRVSLPRDHRQISSGALNGLPE